MASPSRSNGSTSPLAPSRSRSRPPAIRLPFGRPRPPRKSRSPAATDAVTITYTGAVTDAATAIVFNEIQYNPADANTSFVELYNSSTTASFDLSGWRLEGLGYTFPDGAILAPNSYLVLAKDRAAFELVYGSGVKVFGEFPGSLDNGGEHLELIKPGATPPRTGASPMSAISTAPWPSERRWLRALAATGGSPRPIPDRAANWAATATNAPNRVTPGAANTMRQTLACLPRRSGSTKCCPTT